MYLDNQTHKAPCSYLESPFGHLPSYQQHVQLLNASWVCVSVGLSLFSPQIPSFVQTESISNNIVQKNKKTKFIWLHVMQKWSTATVHPNVLCYCFKQLQKKESF